MFLRILRLLTQRPLRITYVFLICRNWGLRSNPSFFKKTMGRNKSRMSLNLSLGASHRDVAKCNFLWWAENTVLKALNLDRFLDAVWDGVKKNRGKRANLGCNNLIRFMIWWPFLYVLQQRLKLLLLMSPGLLKSSLHCKKNSL